MNDSALVGGIAAQAVGTLVGRPRGATLRGTEYCRAEIEVPDSGRLTIVARGELAKQLTLLAKGTAVRVSGPLRVVRWTNAARQEQLIVQVEAEEVDEL